jgi:hypothetical protein
MRTLGRLGRTVVVALVAIAALVPVVAFRVSASLSSAAAQTRLVAALAEIFDAQVELKEFHLRTVPTFRAEGSGLTVRHRGRQDVPPLISIKLFAVESGYIPLLKGHISRLDVIGLEIQIPPDRNRDDNVPMTATRVDSSPRRDLMPALIIDHLFSTAARVTIVPEEANKPPKVWDIHDLRMESLSINNAMPFKATLTNALPPGEISTQGIFGPWQRSAPGHTPLRGEFTIAGADLSVFKGISGVLSAEGRFGGRLAQIDVFGETDTPLFKVKTGLPVPLRTRYHAVVDGTNGNTALYEIDASFLNTALVATGSVIEAGDGLGRTVSLDVTMDHGRLEDVLRLAINTPKPPMKGGLRLSTRFVLPPGDTDVVRRLRLNGQFLIAGSRFTNPDVQQKVDELSKRSRGIVRDEPTPLVPARFGGQFRLHAGRLEIPTAAFDVPGSRLEFNGAYDLVPETMNFRGTLYMNVKLSETTTGLKALLLKAADPFFRRQGGGSAIPIKITGTRNEPVFGLDKAHVLSRDRES